MDRRHVTRDFSAECVRAGRVAMRPGCSRRISRPEVREPAVGLGVDRYVGGGGLG